MQISYQDWSDFLLRVGAICSPAELHGLLCGIQVRGPEENWKNHVREFMDLLDAEDMTTVDTALEAQYELIDVALSDGQLNLQPLLPDDALPLAVRAEALAQWCQGFLHGLATHGEASLLRLDEDAREALIDLAEIARLDDAGAESEAAEQDLMELVEYVRMTLFSTVSQLRTPVEMPDASVTRH
jgi:uncharacterized protein YgfB (UPF0149 family)